MQRGTIVIRLSLEYSTSNSFILNCGVNNKFFVKILGRSKNMKILLKVKALLPMFLAGVSLILLFGGLVLACYSEEVAFTTSEEIT